ncbi:hypothetical protein L7F22_031330 [Adiantum nelumboides]|nr:hypothetical protein [Adiantum nelumboides]
MKGRFPVTWMDATDIARLKERKIRYQLQQREADQEEEGMAHVPPTNAPAAHRGQGNQDQQELVNKSMHSPGTKHWQAVKRIFCYLSGTLHLGLFYPKEGSLLPDLHAFLDSDWAGCFDTPVSTSGFCFILGSSCISWLSKKQPTVAISSCEAEYRVVFIAMIECVWLRRLMADLGAGQDTANTIYNDSQSALAIARNPIFHACTKHIEVHYHYVRERLSAREISLAYVPAQDNLADLFTKALSHENV